MLATIVSTFVGIVATWYFAFRYYKRSLESMPSWIGPDFIKQLKDILAKNPADIEWTTQQVLALYRNTFFAGSRNPTIHDVRYCTSCGSQKLELIFWDVGMGIHDYVLECTECHSRIASIDSDEVSKEQLELLQTRFGPAHYERAPRSELN